MIYSFKDFIPIVHKKAYVHPQATIIGNVIIGKDVYVGPGACIRGDWGEIIIEEGCNVQENCTLHMFPGKTVYLKKGAHIGHGAVIHGSYIGENSLIGMNAVLMDDVDIGKECIVGALSFVKVGTKIPDRKMLVGNPAKIVKDVSDDLIAWKTAGTKLYQQLPADCHASMKLVAPLHDIPKDRPKQEASYTIFKEFIKK